MNSQPRPKIILVFLLLAAVPTAALAQKPLAALAPKQTLAQDTRLDRAVSLDVISVPLGEVLQQESLDKSTEKMEDGHRFLLTAAPDCADLKLQVRLNARPLRTLMTALAEMLPGTWNATPHGYQLSMTMEAAGARAEWWRLFLGEREKALAAQKQAVFDAMQTKAYRRKDSDPDPEQSDRAGEKESADQHDFFHSLPPALKEQIAANMEDTSFYALSGGGYGSGGEKIGAVGWLSQMPPQTQDRFKDAMQANVDRLASVPPALQHYAVEAKKDLAAFDPSSVYFLFQNWGQGVMATPFNGPPSVSGTLSLSVPETLSTPALKLDQTQLADVVLGRQEVPPGLKHMADAVRKQGDAAAPMFKLLAYEVYPLGDAAPVEWKQLAAFQRARVWPNVLPNLPRVDGSLRQAVVSRAAQTDWLGERGHLEYVSDYYCDYITHGGYAMPEAQKKRPVTRPLSTELNELAAKRDVSWRKDAGGITLIRNNRWYRDDGLEVPQPLLRRWFGMQLAARRQDIDWEAARAAFREAAGRQIARPTPLLPQSPEERTATMKQTWDWAAEVFSTLTPWQVYNGLALFQPEERDLAAQNEASSKLFTALGLSVPRSAGSSGYGSIIDPNTQSPPFSETTNALKGLPHTVQFYTSLGDGERAALLAGRLPLMSLNTAQVSHAVSLQPLLPQVMQALPAPSVFLGLLSRGQSDGDRAVFGGFPWMGLEVVTAPQATP